MFKLEYVSAFFRWISERFIIWFRTINVREFVETKSEWVIPSSEVMISRLCLSKTADLMTSVLVRIRDDKT